MVSVKRAMTATAVASLAIVLSGCSIDTLIWGADGAGVISTTEQLIDAASAGDADSFICDGSDPEMREPADWEGLSAEEPEKFVADYWPEMAPLEPSWSINLSLSEKRVATGEVFPGDVFYRETDDELCLVEVAWWTVEG